MKGEAGKIYIERSSRGATSSSPAVVHFEPLAGAVGPERGAAATALHERRVEVALYAPKAAAAAHWHHAHSYKNSASQHQDP